MLEARQQQNGLTNALEPAPAAEGEEPPATEKKPEEKKNE